MVDPDLQQSVHIILKLRNIPACNPVVYVNSYNKQQKQWQEVYKTQGGRTDTNFDFEPIPFVYHFEQLMKLQIRVFNLQDMSQEIGSIETTLHKIMGAKA
jgi:hypothetical protein